MGPTYKKLNFSIFINEIYIILSCKRVTKLMGYLFLIFIAHIAKHKYQLMNLSFGLSVSLSIVRILHFLLLKKLIFKLIKSKKILLFILLKSTFNRRH